MEMLLDLGPGQYREALRIPVKLTVIPDVLRTGRRCYRGDHWKMAWLRRDIEYGVLAIHTEIDPNSTTQVKYQVNGECLVSPLQV